MSEKIAKTGIKRDNDMMYYIKGGDVWSVPRKKPGQPKGKAVKAASPGIELDYSKYLYFDDLVTDEESIRRVEVGKSQPQSVFVLGAIERYPGEYGLWAGRGPDGSWMFVRDRSTQEVYSLNTGLPK